MASLGTLTLDLVAKIGGFEKGMDQAARISEKRLKQITTQAVALGNTLGTYLTRGIDSAAHIIIDLTKNAIDAGDQFAKMSQKVGIAVDDLSKLAYSAQLSDVSLEQLQQGLVKLSDAAVKAQSGVGDQAAAFDALGISVKDAQGNLKSSYDLYLDVADAFEHLQDGASKTAVSIDLFGKAGAELIPALNGGAESIRAAGDELATFGGVITPAAAKASEEFNDNLTRLHKATEGFARQLAGDLLPDLVSLTDHFVEVAKKGDSAQKTADGITAALRALGGVAILVSNAFQIVGDNIAAFVAIGVAVLSGDFKGALAIAKLRVEDLNTDLGDMKHAFDGVDKSAKDAGKSINAFTDPLAAFQATALPDFKIAFNYDPEAAKKAAADLKKAQEEARKHAEAIQKDAVALQDQAATLGYTASQLKLYELAAEGATPAQLELAKAALDAVDAFAKSEDIKAAIDGYKQQAETIGLTTQQLVAYTLAALGATDAQIKQAQAFQATADAQKTLKDAQDEADGVFDSTRTAAEQYATTLERLIELRNTLGADGQPLISEDTFQRAIDQAKVFDETFTGAFEAYRDSIKNIGGLLGGDFVSALDSASKSLSDVAAQTLLWGESGTEAVKAIARTVITDLVSSLIEAGVRTVALAALQEKGIVGTAATAATAAQTVAGVQVAASGEIAAAAAPAAGLTSLASFGANAGFAIAGIAAVLATIKAFGGFKEGGYTGGGGVNNIAGVVHGQEFIVSAPNVPRNRAALEAINNGVVLADHPGGGSGTINLPIHNYGEPLQVRIARVRGQMIAELVPLAASAAENSIAAGILNDRSPVGSAVSNKFGVQGKAQR